LICFVDALDECAEKDVRAIVEFLDDLSKVAVSTGVFLSTRHYPHIAIRNALELNIEGQDDHLTDVATCVESKFNAASIRQIDKIKAKILKGTSGVLLWIVLVIQMLNKAYDHGEVHAMRR
jgi:hypothetical protein